MSKPIPFRKKDVTDKLDYALDRHQELMDILFQSKKAASDPKFLVHTCADILSTARECFDYLAQDIIECYIIPSTSNPKIKKDHSSGKLRCYFPYYESQINKPESPFFELATASAPFYQSLLDFTRSIARNVTIPNTRYTYKMLLDVKDMVNEKKHDKLIAVVSNADGEYLIENESIRMVLPLQSQSGWSYFAVEPGTSVQRVAEYRFAYNNQEVGKFCQFATKATEHVIGELYDFYFD